MKWILIYFAITFGINFSYAQDMDLKNESSSPDYSLLVKFENEKQLVYIDNDLMGKATIEIIIKNIDEFSDEEIELVVKNNELSPEFDDIYLPYRNSFKIDLGEKKANEVGELEIKKSFLVKFKGDKVSERVLILGMIIKKDGKKLDVPALSTTRIHIKPPTKPLDENDSNNDFWLFTGTNLDLLNGVKAQDIYFKGSFISNIPKKNGEKSTNSIYVKFGSKRYFTEKDTLYNRPFEKIVTSSTYNDSLKVIRGAYNSSVETITDNVYISVDHLYCFTNSNESSNLYLSSGIYIGLKSFHQKFSNSIMELDTIQVPIPSDGIYRYKALPVVRKFNQMNFNFHSGLLHVYRNEKINVKSQLNFGVDFLTVPFSIRSNDMSGQYEKALGIIGPHGNLKRIFTNISIEGTVLNPGLSIGFEVYYRVTEYPFFNVSISKVFDLDGLSALFNKVSP